MGLKMVLTFAKWWPKGLSAALVVLGMLWVPTTQANAQQLRIGSLVPKNSLYHRQLLEVAESWRTAQGAGAKYLVYPDGSQGGEAEMARRMRIGQLQGALLSVVGLREIEPSIAALQSMPLLFRNWEELDYVREKMRPAMEKKFLDKGFVVLAWGDAGWVRFFSKEAALRPDDYKRMKFFAWGSEPDQQNIMKSLGYTPVPLETPFPDLYPATSAFDPYFAPQQLVTPFPLQQQQQQQPPQQQPPQQQLRAGKPAGPVPAGKISESKEEAESNSDKDSVGGEDATDDQAYDESGLHSIPVSFKNDTELRDFLIAPIAPGKQVKCVVMLDPTEKVWTFTGSCNLIDCLESMESSQESCCLWGTFS
jgi:hypothetical protein